MSPGLYCFDLLKNRLDLFRVLGENLLDKEFEKLDEKGKSNFKKSAFYYTFNKMRKSMTKC